ncbi:MAG TPA: mechanosensitive ion channel domain-containing protein [Myxococcota bacterium]
MPDSRHRRSATIPLCHVGGALCALFLLAAAFLAAVPAAAQAPATPAPQPSEAPEKPKAQPIPIAEIAVRAEQAKRSLDEVARELKPDAGVVAVEESLPEIGARVRQQLADAEEATAATPTLLELDELNMRWNTLRGELSRQQAVLRTRSAGVEERIDRIRTVRERWAATRAAALAEEAPREALQQISDVEAAISAASDQARGRQGAIVHLQSRVAQLEQVVDADLERLAEVRRALMGQVFRAENPPLWRPRAFALLGVREALERVAAAQRRDLEAIERFGEMQSRGIAIHLAFLAIMVVAMLAVRHRVRRYAHDPAFDTARAICERPISMALMLTLLVAAWTLPQPRLLAHLVSLAVLVPAVLILRNLLDRPVYPLLDALLGFWVVDRIRGLLSPLPHAPRLLFALEMLALIALAIWWMRPGRPTQLARVSARGPLYRVLDAAARIVLLAALVALAAEVAGYSALGSLIGDAVLFAYFGGFILYGAVRVVEGLVTFALHVRPLRLLGMVKRHSELICQRALYAVRIGAVSWWLYATLLRLEILDEVWAGVLAILTAEIRIGEAHLSAGDLVAFGVTIWLTFQLSRFLRFLLEEDIYTRVRLRKGMPYAVSTLAHYTILTLGFIVAVLALGVDLNRFALLAGAFGVGIGFGLQNIVNNFVSGLILLTERPVEVGDTISLGDVFGEVRRIGIRSSTVGTWQGAEVIVPNADLVSEQVINWTHSDRRRRIEIPVGVAYGSNPKRVMEVLLEVARGNANVMRDPEPYILFMGFGDSSLDFEVRAWTQEFDFFQRVRSELCVGFEAALREAGIVIPFPQRDLHIRSVAASQGEAAAPQPAPPAASPERGGGSAGGKKRG